MVAEFALKRPMPTMFGLDTNVEAGGLILYGPDIDHIWRRAAGFIDMILKGAKPGDLPIEEPTKFQLVINLNTAKALGLTLPPSCAPTR